MATINLVKEKMNDHRNQIVSLFLFIFVEIKEKNRWKLVYCIIQGTKPPTEDSKFPTVWWFFFFSKVDYVQIENPFSISQLNCGFSSSRGARRGNIISCYPFFPVCILFPPLKRMPPHFTNSAHFCLLWSITTTCRLFGKMNFHY
jgi:hypothetical protein